MNLITEYIFLFFWCVYIFASNGQTSFGVGTDFVDALPFDSWTQSNGGTTSIENPDNNYYYHGKYADDLTLSRSFTIDTSTISNDASYFLTLSYSFIFGCNIEADTTTVTLYVDGINESQRILTKDSAEFTFAQDNPFTGCASNRDPTYIYRSKIINQTVILNGNDINTGSGNTVEIEAVGDMSADETDEWWIIGQIILSIELQSFPPTYNPTNKPSIDPTSMPTNIPSGNPTNRPTSEPTDKPTNEPSALPTDRPTDEPTSVPSDRPTDNPTDRPSNIPTDKPTNVPTDRPTSEPTDRPTITPTGPSGISTSSSTTNAPSGPSGPSESSTSQTSMSTLSTSGSSLTSSETTLAATDTVTGGIVTDEPSNIPIVTTGGSTNGPIATDVTISNSQESTEGYVDTRDSGDTGGLNEGAENNDDSILTIS